MKNIILMSLALVVVLTFTTYAMAESQSDAASTSAVNIDDHSQSETNVKEKQTYLTPTKLDGSFVSAPQLYYDPKLSIPDDAIPEIYRIEGWKVLYADPYRDSVKVKRIKKERKAWISDEESLTGEKVDPDAKAENDNDYVVPLPYYPEEAIEVATAKVFLQDEKYTINQAVSEVWYHAWDKSDGAKYYVILYNSRLVSEVRVAAIGSAIIGGLAIGSEASTKNPVIGAGGGSGFGTAKAHVFKEPTFMVIALSNAGKMPKRLLKKEEPPKEVAKPVEQPKPELETVKLEPEIATVEFEIDKDKIENDQQKAMVVKAAKTIAKNWKKKVQAEGASVLIVGSCSPEGSVEYNDSLGRRRAENAYESFKPLIKAELEKLGINITDDEIRNAVIYTSASKVNIKYVDLSKQRNVTFYLGNAVTAGREVQKE